MKINRMTRKIVSGLLILTLLYSNTVFAGENEDIISVNDDVISGASVDIQTTSAYAASSASSIYLCNNDCYIDVSTGVITGFDDWYISTGTETTYIDENNKFVDIVPTAIGDNAVKNNSSYLEYIELSDSITSIGKEAFADCKYLDAIVIPDSVTYIADDAFVGCNVNMIVFCEKGSYADNFDFYPDGVKINYGIPALSRAEASGEPGVAANTVIKKDNEIHSLKITPMIEVKPDSEIYVKINNGSFDKSLIDECSFKSQSGATWEYLYNMFQIRGSNIVTRDFIGNYGSRELPYKLEYIDSATLKITLFPLDGHYAYMQSSEITLGIPIYNIKLPAVSGNIEGRITVSIDGNGTSIESCDNIVYAYNDGFKETDYNKLSTHYVERELSVEVNEQILYNNQPNAVYIRPTSEVLNNAYIYIKVRNGSFNEEILKDCEFRTNHTGSTYDQLLEEYNKTGDNRFILNRFIRNESSRQLPYKLEFVDSQTIKVWLYPIDDGCVNTSNNGVTQGTALYRIPLPVVSGNENGYTQIAIDSGNSSINSGGWYTIARINSTADYESEYKWNSYFTITNQVKVNSGSSVLYNEKPLALKVKPLTGIGENESILINIDNGYFDETLFNSCEFKTNYTKMTYDILLDRLNVGMHYLNQILQRYIKEEDSSQLPYKLEYVDSDTIKVWLFPINDVDVASHNSVTRSDPVYNILLPVVAGKNNGDITIAVDGNGSSIQTGGWYKLGTVEKGLEEIPYSEENGTYYYNPLSGEITDFKEADPYSSNKFDLNIPETINGINITAIREGAFAECKNIQKVVLPESILSIDDNAFENCDSLTEINIPKSVTFIGNDVFLDCNMLEKVYVYKNSYADNKDFYSNGVSIEYVADFIKGDINGDGKVTAVDAMLIAQLASGKRVDEAMYSKADLNNDGKVTAIDAMLVARYASGKITSL